MKYQFCIRFTNIDKNSAASKAVADCNAIFLKSDYNDYTFVIDNNDNKIKYYILLLKEVINFYFSIKKNSIVVVQYPLLSINNVFKYFINIAKQKGIKFYCLVHDLESLRTGGNDVALIETEIDNLGCYDCVIAHNQEMKKWLIANGLSSKLISLGLFDYLVKNPPVKIEVRLKNTIVFAGNLSKSTFIYLLGAIKKWNFNLYGPGFIENKNNKNVNLKWCGEFSPEDIVNQLEGSFGLIWDGRDIEKCDDMLGNYLKYNNPHKISLYIAAGLPIIAPASSAIGEFIKLHNIGLLINNLFDLDSLPINEESYLVMKNNLKRINEKIVNGDYLKSAITLAEAEVYRN